MAVSKKIRVVLTRENNELLANILRKKNIEAIEIPLVKTDTDSSVENFDDIFQDMGRYDWITFSSANGVSGFFREFFARFKDIRTLGISRIACVGEATANEVRKFFLNVDIVPKTATAVEMAKAMGEFESLENLRVLCIQGNLSSPELLKNLEEQKAIVESMETYKTSMVELSSNDKSAKDFRKLGANAVVFASPSAVESFAKNAKVLSLEKGAISPKIIAIGTTTSAAIKKFGMKVAEISENPGPEAIAEAIENSVK